MPYAYSATVTYEFDVDHLNVWVTFRQPMDQTLEPALDLWLLELDDVPTVVTDSEWLDEHTLLLTVDPCASAPERVTLEYDGPSVALVTTWNKQWEPWGPIVATDLTATLWVSGMIILWSGSVASIPSGWALCDGDNGTPDLTDRFVIQVGTHAPGWTGGASSHYHTIQNDTHNHGVVSGYAGIGTGTAFQPITTNDTHNHAETSSNNIPPAYALCYIMKL
jgi:hypothetical protein